MNEVWQPVLWSPFVDVGPDGEFNESKQLSYGEQESHKGGLEHIKIVRSQQQGVVTPLYPYLANPLSKSTRKLSSEFSVGRLLKHKESRQYVLAFFLFFKQN